MLLYNKETRLKRASHMKTTLSRNYKHTNTNAQSFVCIKLVMFTLKFCETENNFFFIFMKRIGKFQKDFVQKKRINFKSFFKGMELKSFQIHNKKDLNLSNLNP